MKSMGTRGGRVAVLASAGLGVLLMASTALAGVCFTSGKVYVQQKVWGKAAQQLECARREEPDNTQVYSLLGIARYNLKQYAAAGAAFQLGIDASTKKNDRKHLEETTTNRRAIYGELFNKGIAALRNAGRIAEEDTRTMDAGSPQAAVAKERGEPKDYSRFTENGKVHEFWYYPEQGIGFHFAPSSPEPLQFAYKPFQGSADPKTAVTDTTAYPAYQGASAVAEAAYNFELASLVDPSSSDIYKNLSYTYGVLGRPDDAIRAAQKGLALKPGDKELTQNLRVAAMGRGNRLFNGGKFSDAIPAYRAAMQYDPDGTIRYLSLIAESFQRAAESMKDDSQKQQRAALLDSAGAAYMTVYEKAPADSAGAVMKENAIYNAAVIQVNLENYPKAVEILDKGAAAFPRSKDIFLLSGETKFQTNDLNGSIAAMRKVVEIDPKDARAHEILFHALSKQNKTNLAVPEYTIYKALSEGKPRTGSQLKIWVESADNRLPKGHQLKKTVAAEGLPDEVRTFSDGDKMLESWFYWSKGKSITFLEGQVFSQATFPPAKM